MHTPFNAYRSDMAYDSDYIDKIKSKAFIRSGTKIKEFNIDDGLDIGKGTYFVCETGPVWLFSQNKRKQISFALSSILNDIISIQNAKFDINNIKILIACLGNNKISADSLGPSCANKIIVTKDLINPILSKSIETSVIIPNIKEETGIESTDLIKKTCEIVKPDILLCIDSLATRNPEHIASSIQISDIGITPGECNGKEDNELSYKTLGIPVITIGVPMVVHSKTLVNDVLRKCGILLSHDEIDLLIKKDSGYFVTPSNVDIVIKTYSEIISRAINISFTSISEY